MIDYYKNARACMDKYNNIQELIRISPMEINDDEEEFLVNFCIYMAHALIKDTGFGGASRDELSHMADIINDVVR